YKYTPATQHAPLIGFAFDGYPVYGPYGYTNAMDPGSAITRMKSGYSLRNITTRTTLASGAAAPQVGPAVSTTYPIGTYSEDYEWLASNGGDLDQYNGRMCVTPEYPAGTYAYFVTIDANGQPAYPYIIGPEYYGEPDQANLNTNGPNPTPIQVPATATNCILPTDVDALGMLAGKLVLVPNPAISGKFRIPGNNHPFDEVMVYNMHGQVVQRQRISGSMDHVVQLPSEGMYFVRATETSTGKTAVQKIVWAAGY
ncbi:MAG: YHYH protein, partial [Sphingobacteriales bacterium]